MGKGHQAPTRWQCVFVCQEMNCSVPVIRELLSEFKWIISAYSAHRLAQYNRQLLYTTLSNKIRCI